MADKTSKAAKDKDKTADSGVYQVLARKYRPTDFTGLIGQDALVRTLTNAIDSGRIAHAFMLTGVRGVGKTTTARIIARMLNCIGADGKGKETITPCGVCEHCRAIAEDRHVDVLEIDAASHTGVDNIREITDSARYSPASARYKIFVIDEVHMLSNQAFNALLKTLEEPPEHVKFIFATTEIRKVPITVLSRCQRFDLRRVDADVLKDYFKELLKKENIKAENDEVLSIISRAADGSVRDGLSILDQAIALSNGTITIEQLREMLGLADRARIFELLENMLKGKAIETLDIFTDLNKSGAEPEIIIKDLLEITHILTKLKLIPSLADSADLPEIERTSGAALAKSLSVPVLNRCWQILLNGLGEVRLAPSPYQAAEMVLLRLIYAADLPDPAALIKQFKNSSDQIQPAQPQNSQNNVASNNPQSAISNTRINIETKSNNNNQTESQAYLQTQAQAPTQAQAKPIETENFNSKIIPFCFRDIISVLYELKEGVLAAHLATNAHEVSFAPCRVEIRTRKGVPPNFLNLLGKYLSEYTGQRWLFSHSKEQGLKTIKEQDLEAKSREFARVAQDKEVKKIFAAFPDAEIISLRPLQNEISPPNIKNTENDNDIDNLIDDIF